MSDIIATFGSRLGIGICPAEKTAYLQRSGSFPGLAMQLNIGVHIEGRVITFPFCEGGEDFEFYDQEMTPTGYSITGIDPSTGITLKMHITGLFRPKDVRFSTTPALIIRAEVSRLPSRFRWRKMNTEAIKGEMFFLPDNRLFDVDYEQNHLNLSYSFPYERPDNTGLNPYVYSCESNDRIEVISGDIKTDEGVFKPFDLNLGEKAEPLTLAWCVYDTPLLMVKGEISDYKYKDYFASLFEVGKFCRDNLNEILDNAQKVDRIILNNNLSTSVNHLICQTLHSWLANTWYTTLQNGDDWFSCWEGGGYFHSSLDVEFSQAPFYLSVWPELLQMILNEFSDFIRDGSVSIGNAGKDTLTVSHDMGEYCNCDGQKLWIDQELEENSNYIILQYTLWKRTGDKWFLNNIDTVKGLLDFIVATDFDGDGISDQPFHSTLDDACLPLRSGEKLTYIAVKCLVACKVGAEMLQKVGIYELDKYDNFALNATKTIEENGWMGTHYVSSLADIQGAKLPHIHTLGGLAILNMVGFKAPLDTDRLRCDLLTSAEKTLGRYGCRHSEYIDKEILRNSVHGDLLNAPKVGWISLCLTRDIAGLYLGVDTLDYCSRYWDWQTTVNSREYTLFIETFYGNNLIYYPRGVAVFGLLEGSAGLILNRADNIKKTNPVRTGLKLPLLSQADWKSGSVPIIHT